MKVEGSEKRSQVFLFVLFALFSISSSLAIRYRSEQFLLNAYQLPGLDSDVLKSGTHYLITKKLHETAPPHPLLEAGTRGSKQPFKKETYIWMI